MSEEVALPPTPTLETERLIIRPLRLQDAPTIQRGFADWEVIKHLHAGIPWPFPEDGAETNVRDCLQARDRGEQFFWVLTFRENTDEAIGRIDLRPEALKGRDMRGFWLAREFWGRGLMTEAAECVTAYVFDELRWPHIYLTNAAANSGSHRIKVKQGADLVDVVAFDYVSGPDLRETWILRRKTWLARRLNGKAMIENSEATT